MVYVLIIMHSVANSPMSTYGKLSLLWYQCTTASQTLPVAQAPIVSPPIIAGELVTAVHKLQTDYWPIKTVIFTHATNNIHDVIIIAAFKYLEHHIYLIPCNTPWQFLDSDGVAASSYFNSFLHQELYAWLNCLLRNILLLYYHCQRAISKYSTQETNEPTSEVLCGETCTLHYSENSTLLGKT